MKSDPSTRAGSAQTNRDRAVESTAAIARHPIHPMLVPLPIGLFIAALGSDIGFWLTGTHSGRGRRCG